MIIFGIDPGLAISGYGVVNYIGNKFEVLEYGAVITNSCEEFPNRLKIIYDSYTELFEKYKPEAVSIEELFYNKNVKTAIAVAQARGVHLLAAVNQSIPLYEYTPLQIKQGIVGYGRAEKRQVQEMVKVILKLDEVPKPDDVADGLAAAICHAHSLKFANKFKIEKY
ncbi:crossover junction endodeoxyribonuclease RuvC [Sedimentibacter acidaminivorans]|uniref:Crossover junction endodeoxyribonuclease RuvC n=1 Tax=Sedimentibacter acidaminivorans TaxID=913099 RepID=A0ABS4GBF9_9FIRM|nr:crossover junction endodeoxyribonuclease RuvC [Sedimentibacter acidaminivorans]MBP1925023.1 crossover junction endodeoxyribonuclease RuvC [Sedimentibacter acidaminivorans]